MDRGGFLPLHSAYYVLLRDGCALDYVTIVLNSSTVEFLIRLLAPVAKDGFSRFRRQFLATIPIPVPDLRTQRAIVNAATLADAASVDEMVGKLFRLDLKATARIKAYLDARAHGASE